MDAAKIKSIRESTGKTQARFAKDLGISIRTLQEWEQGRCRPSGPAAKLLELTEKRTKK